MTQHGFFDKDSTKSIKVNVEIDFNVIPRAAKNALSSLLWITNGGEYACGSSYDSTEMNTLDRKYYYLSISMFRTTGAMGLFCD